MAVLIVGNVGTEITLDCGVDITTATVMKIIARKPVTGQRVEWTAELEGTTSVKYTTVAGDISTAGILQLQAYIEMPSWSGYGNKVNVTVVSAI